MAQTDWRRIGLAAAILLLPGGFVLGATLAARRRKAKNGPEHNAPAQVAPQEEPGAPGASPRQAQ